jgi:hypothetical protein
VRWADVSHHLAAPRAGRGLSAELRPSSGVAVQVSGPPHVDLLNAIPLVAIVAAVWR